MKQLITDVFQQVAPFLFACITVSIIAFIVRGISKNLKVKIVSKYIAKIALTIAIMLGIIVLNLNSWISVPLVFVLTMPIFLNKGEMLSLAKGVPGAIAGIPSFLSNLMIFGGAIIYLALYVAVSGFVIYVLWKFYSWLYALIFS